ncbi:agamous-like MADS-box protein AGL29 [Solanum dulcamara]|uniref:agamous-like MADS-box protein AGL29 n=1 Tax=Solanum dulcamara TaxID=45834 RepID=UPI002485740E|nr:agamous-like MADS-box protein AGL29 [Solanum dulcamara]
MDKRARKGRQKIDMKLIESKKAHTFTFSKRKKSLFKKANEYSTLTGAYVGVLFFSPSGKPYSYGSKGIEKITNKFLELKLDDRQRDHADVGKSNVLEAFEDLCKEVQALIEKEKEHPRSNILSDKHMLEQFMAIKLRLDKVKKERKGKCIPEPEEEESS